MIKIIETTKKDLKNIQALWADKDVMKYVGHPEGLMMTMQELEEWYDLLESSRPYTNHYSIYKNDQYCGETFYHISLEHDYIASLDIKLFKEFRGQGIATKALSFAIQEAFKNGAKKVWVDPKPQNIKAIALYERLGFVRKPMPEYLIESEGIEAVYMEKENI